MTFKSWLRVLAITLAILLVWAIAFTVVEYQVATRVSRERHARQRQELIDRLIEAGRGVEEIRAALEALDRRYGDEADHEGR